jgi:putative heme-binding domain, Pirellula/Verrucomicrobium type
MHAFVKAQCTQCHVAAGHGANLGPDLVESVKKLRGRELLSHIVDPSEKIDDRYRTVQFILANGRVQSGVVVGETPTAWRVMPNLLTPEEIVLVSKDAVDERIESQVSPMPAGLLNVLTRDEILALLAFLEAGENLPESVSAHEHRPAATSR